MSGDAGINSGPTRIDEDRDGDRQFLLHPEDNDLFVRTGRQIIQACQLKISVETWLKEFSGMLAHVRAWATGRASSIAACYATSRNGRVVLFFVPSGERFDFDLADALVELNTDLLKEFNIGMVEIHQVPASELERFLDSESGIHVYGDAPAPHRPVET